MYWDRAEDAYVVSIGAEQPNIVGATPLYAASAPAVAAQGDELPPLPEPLAIRAGIGVAINEGCEASEFYTDDQMRAYARAALAGRRK
jgi:hypothetical protein